MKSIPPFFDLASLAKPLVTAPLVHDLLDLDADRRAQLGFKDRSVPLTVRQLLSHSAGLPPWLPYTGEPLPEQLQRGFPVGVHPLLRTATVGVSTYSDLGYRLLGELLEQATGRPFPELGAEASGLSPAPFPMSPVTIPEGPDVEAWCWAAPQVSVPTHSSCLPHDANARAGMRGHAGFGATPDQMRQTLEAWVRSGYPARMAIETARSEDGTRWGLGLQRSLGGVGRFGDLLSNIPADRQGIHVLSWTEERLSPPPPEPEPDPAEPTDWWMHFGFTGPALFIRPADGHCICILAHRRGPKGELLDAKQLQARRWEVLAARV